MHNLFMRLSPGPQLPVIGRGTGAEQSHLLLERQQLRVGIVRVGRDFELLEVLLQAIELHADVGSFARSVGQGDGSQSRLQNTV